MRAAGASTRQPRLSPVRREAVLAAIAAGLIALGTISPAAVAQDEPPLGPSATIGTLAVPDAGAPAQGEVSRITAAPAATASPAADLSAMHASPVTTSTGAPAPGAAPASANVAGAPPAGSAGAVANAVAPTAGVDTPAVTQNQSSESAPAGTTIIPSAAEPQDFQNSQVLNYQANQQMPLNEPPLHSLQEFMSEGVNTSPLGVELQEGARRLKSGREVDGLLVVALEPGSPAERAGVQAGHRAAHDVLEGAAVAASLVFPPAVLAVPVIETMQFGENYDLIIGIDGNRVTNFMDFQDKLRDALPGETVYLNILRAGKRLQVPVEMPSPSANKLNP